MMSDSSNTKKPRFNRNEIAAICDHTIHDLAIEPAWYAHKYGFEFLLHNFESDYEYLCDVMEQNGMDSTALREAKKLLDNEMDVVCHHNPDPTSPEGEKRVHKLDQKFIHAIEDSCKEISKTFNITNELNPPEPSMEEDSREKRAIRQELDDKEYIPFC